MVLDGPPREPCRYSETDHFADCFDDPMRFITRGMVGEVIEGGRDYPDEGGPNKVRRKREYGGVDAVLVIARDDPVLITGWTEVRDWVDAAASERWSLEQLRTIRAFEDKDHYKW
jgi:hypothetical protein